MTPDDVKDFFVASAGVAGALVGLLFVAISVSQARLAESPDTQLYRVRASASLTSFTNALTVSLFALVPGKKLGIAALTVGIVGVLFVLGSLLSVLRVRRFRWTDVRDETFLVGLVVMFVVQVVTGIHIIDSPSSSGNVNILAIIVIVSFLVGIARAWELIGGPSIGLGSEVFRRVREHKPD